MKRLLALTTAALPLFAMAHPGHGEHGEHGGYTIIHYFTEPQHAVITLGVMTAAIVLILRERRKKRTV